jgi:hypothetical protein
MRLGELITGLELCPDADALVEIAGRPAGEFHSYRGSYDQLALGTGSYPLTVGALLSRCRNADGETFEGYKGGDYMMSRDTPVWFADWGEYPGRAIVGINPAGSTVQLLTADISEYV